MALPETYRELLLRLFRARRHGVKLSLERVKAVRERLARPDESIQLVVQIGGTNGKGSTAAFVASMLAASGLRTGVYTSPHLIAFSERFQVDGRPLGDDVLLAAAREVLQQEDPKQELTFFEIITLMAAVAFARTKVQAAVFEVGLGGRFDATTALKADVAVVTGVALDHEAMLGDTLAKIAQEKGGIFRFDKPAVIGCSGEPEAVPVLLDMARRHGAEPILEVANADAVRGELGLLGAHQRCNAAAALGAMEALAQVRRVPWPPGVLEGGLAAARLPGRLERIGNALLDGAHNPAGARALAAAVSDLAMGRPRHLVIGVSRDKNLAAMAQALAPVVDRVFATAAKSERASDPRMVAQAFLDVRPDLLVGVVEPVHAALQAATGGQTLVCGSLFVVGEARAALLGQRSEEMTISDPMP